MKNYLLAIAIGVAFAASALADGVTVVQCRDTSGLPNGLSINISRDVDTQELSASFANRDNIGPYVHLGTIPTEREYFPPEVMGAPIAYVGDNFELHIRWDGGPGPGGAFPSHVWLKMDDRTFNEAMYCVLTADW